MISTLLLLSTLSCRVRHSTESSTSHSTSETSEYLDIWQVVERYDTLGRLVERHRTKVSRSRQDSTTISTRRQSERSTQSTIAKNRISIKTLTLSLIVGFALGSITILYLRKRLRRLRQASWRPSKLSIIAYSREDFSPLGCSIFAPSIGKHKRTRIIPAIFSGISSTRQTATNQTYT